MYTWSVPLILGSGFAAHVTVIAGTFVEAERTAVAQNPGSRVNGTARRIGRC